MADMTRQNLPFAIAQSNGIEVKQVADIVAPSRQFDAQQVKQGSDVIRAKVKKNNTPVTFVFDNSGGMAAASFIIGDPTGAIEAKSGLTLAAATSGTMSPAAWNRLLGAPESDYAVKAINYNTSSDPTQFAQAFNVAYFEGPGDFSTKSIDTYIAAGRRNTQMDPLLQTMDLTEDMPVLNSYAALIITVLAGETVTLTLSPGITKVK